MSAFTFRSDEATDKAIEQYKEQQPFYHRDMPKTKAIKRMLKEYHILNNRVKQLEIQAEKDRESIVEKNNIIDKFQELLALVKEHDTRS